MIFTRDFLTQFCATAPGKEKFAEPWSKNSHSWACSGTILIRVDRLADVEDRKDAPATGPARFALKNAHDQARRWGPLPNWAPSTKRVKIGAGWFAVGLLEMIRNLPELTVGGHPQDFRGPLAFKGPGYIGALMPLNIEAEPEKGETK